MRGTLRGNEGPSCLRGSLVAMAILSGATVGSANNILQMTSAYCRFKHITRRARDSLSHVYSHEDSNPRDSSFFPKLLPNMELLDTCIVNNMGVTLHDTSSSYIPIVSKKGKVLLQRLTHNYNKICCV